MDKRKKERMNECCFPSARGLILLTFLCFLCVSLSVSFGIQLSWAGILALLLAAL